MNSKSNKVLNITPGKWIKTLLMVLAIGYISGCSKDQPNPSYGKAEWVETSGSVTERIELPQNWDQQTRNDFWFTSQGSRFIPYAWFTWLEQAGNEELFRHTENLYRLGYIPERSSQKNPAGLPIGFALNTGRHTGDDWLGFTCAACHTAEVEFDGKQVLVEGGPTMGNVMQFFKELRASTQATYNNNEKFQRFAQNVLGDNLEPKQEAELKQALLDQIEYFNHYLLINEVPEDYPSDFSGYGRIDAFGIIQNMGTAFAQDKLSNMNIPDAPVSYPFLWGSHQSDRVQWNGMLSNGNYGVGPLTRNTGEVVGVFGGLAVERAPWWQRLVRKNKYEGHIEIANLGDIESWLRDLRSPQWPEDVLPPIDQELAAAGEEIYRNEAGCIYCHQIVEREDEDKLYKATLVPVAQVGTDDLMTKNAQDHQAYTFLLEGTKKAVIAGDTFDEKAPSIEFAVNGTFGLLLKEPLVAAQAAWKSRQIDPENVDQDSMMPTTEAEAKAFLTGGIEDHAEVLANMGCEATDHALHTGTLSEEEKAYCYKARPHTGIWATAPYLHNGSVPTLRDMLRRPEDRPTTFWVGSREFDPVNVGFVATEIPGTQQSKFEVYKSDGETVQPGNSNKGHPYGTYLTEEKKMQLLEFLKTL